MRELTLRLQEQEKMLRKKSKKRQKSNGVVRTPRYNNGEEAERDRYNFKSLERSPLNQSHDVSQNSRFGNLSKLKNQSHSELVANLNKALDRLYEQEEKIENLEKLNTLTSLEHS